MTKNDKKNQVKIRILPLKGIGGVGNAGDVAWMDREEAIRYEQDGFLEIITDEEVEVVHSSAPDVVHEKEGETDSKPDAVNNDAEIIEKINAVTEIKDLYAFQVEGRSEAVENAINAKGISLHEAEQEKVKEDHSIMPPKKIRK